MWDVVVQVYPRREAGRSRITGGASWEFLGRSKDRRDQLRQGRNCGYRVPSRGSIGRIRRAHRRCGLNRDFGCFWKPSPETSMIPGMNGLSTDHVFSPSLMASTFICTSIIETRRGGEALTHLVVRLGGKQMELW